MTLRWAAAFLFCFGPIVAASDWPQWRGPEGQGHAHTTGLPLHWSETNNVTWKTPVPGRGWSSPVIESNQIWMTTAFESPAEPEDAERRLKADTGKQPLTVLEEVGLHAVCVDKATGRLLHNIELLRVKEPQWVHQLNSYASPTPVIEEGRLYCHFGTFGTACVDTGAGAVLWTNCEHRLMHENGPGSTPMLWRDLLIFHCDGSDVQYITALDKRSGKTVWKTARSGEMNKNPQLKKSYGTPLLVEIQGKPQLMSPAADWLYAYDPATGRELSKMSYGALGFSISARPVTGHGLIYMSTGFMRPELLAIRADSAAGPEIAWRFGKGVPNVPSPLLVGDELYFVSDAGGMLTCLDARTGAEQYRERLGGNFSASPVFADGKIYISSREGRTSVLAPGRSFKRLAENQLDGQLMASAAVVDGALFLRTDKALYRIEQKRK